MFLNTSSDPHCFRPVKIRKIQIFRHDRKIRCSRKRAAIKHLYGTDRSVLVDLSPVNKGPVTIHPDKKAVYIRALFAEFDEAPHFRINEPEEFPVVERLNMRLDSKYPEK